MLAGDFSEIVKVYTDSANEIGGCRTNPVNNSAGAGFPATPGFLRLTDAPNYINPARFSKAALRIVHLLPQVNGMRDNPNGSGALPLSLWSDNPLQPGHTGAAGTDPCGRVFYSEDERSTDQQIIAKIDYNRTSTHTIFGRVMYTPQYTHIPAELEQERIGFMNTVNLNTGGQDNLGSFYTIGDTYLVSPNTVNTASIAVNRTSIHRIGPLAYDIYDVGINAFTYVKKNFYISGLGFSGNGGTQNDSKFVTNTFQLTDTLNMIRGNHQISLGGSLAHWRILAYANVRSIPSFSFADATTDPESTGLAVANFLLGKFVSFRQATPNGLNVQQWYTMGHVSDTWRVSPRLTINAGVRYEPYLPQEQKDGHIYNFDYQRMVNNVKSQVFLNAPAGFYYPGDEGFPSQAGINRKWGLFTPRIGFGWDPRGDGVMSIRASYGLSYNFINGQYHLNTNIAPPFGNDTIVPRYANASLDDPWVGYPGGPGFEPGKSFFPYDNSTKNKNVGFAPLGLFLSMPYDQPPPSVQSWNLTFQRQLRGGIFVSVQYTGNATRHMWHLTPMNPAVFVPGTGRTNNGCMVPDGRGGATSVLVAAGTVTTIAQAQNSNSACSTTQAANVNARRILALTRPDIAPYVNVVDGYTSSGNASYNGLVISVRRQATRNLNLTGNYTWSHCINDPNTALGTNPNVNTGYTFFSINGKEPGAPSTEFWDANGQFLPGVNGLTASIANRNWGRANCGSDRRRRLNSTAVFSTPSLTGNRILNMVTSGWRVSSIFTMSSGSFMSVTAGEDVARIAGSNGGQTAVQLQPDVYTEGRPHGPRAQYLRPNTGNSIFVLPAIGTIAPNHGLSNIEGPPTWQWDASLARTFNVREGHRVEFRVDAYNVTNSFRPGGNPTTGITSGNYGVITNAANPRDMQFSARYIF
jgi:hypothetical protein